MLNCKNCGAPLTLEDAVCPHCGTINEEAREHIEKLAKLNKDYKETRTEVISEVKKTKKGYNLLIILVMLLLANLLLIPFHSASYEIAERINASSLDKEEIIDQMNEYLDEKEYIRFVEYYDRYEIRYSDIPDHYPIYYLACEYSQISHYVSDYYHEKDLYSDPLVRACQSIRDYEEEYDRRSKRDLSDFTLNHIEKLNTEVELFLKTYLHLQDEDFAKIADMSDSELLILVNERLQYEE